MFAEPGSEPERTEPDPEARRSLLRSYQHLGPVTLMTAEVAFANEDLDAARSAVRDFIRTMAEHEEVRASALLEVEDVA